MEIKQLMSNPIYKRSLTETLEHDSGVCMCVWCMGVRVCLHASTHLYRYPCLPEVDVRRSFSVASLPYEIGSVPEPGSPHFSNKDWPVTSRDLPVSICRSTPPSPTFYIGAKDPNLGLHICAVSILLNHLPSSPVSIQG